MIENKFTKMAGNMETGTQHEIADTQQDFDTEVKSYNEMMEQMATNFQPPGHQGRPPAAQPSHPIPV